MPVSVAVVSVTAVAGVVWTGGGAAGRGAGASGPGGGGPAGPGARARSRQGRAPPPRRQADGRAGAQGASSVAGPRTLSPAGRVERGSPGQPDAAGAWAGGRA